MEQEQVKPVSDRVEFFDRPDEAAAVDRSLIKFVEGLRKGYVSQFISERNLQRYNHGGEWIHPAHEQNVSTSTHRIESVWTIPFHSLVDNDLEIILRSLRPLSEDMNRQFAKHMYEMLGEAAAAVGNVVNNKAEGSVANGLLAMFRKIELSVGRDGKVTLPQIHMNPKTLENVEAELSQQPPEFRAELDRIIADKSSIALERERARRAKFIRQDQS